MAEEPLHAAYAGPWYVEVGTNTKIPYGGFETSATGATNGTASSSWTYYDYEPADVEFYQYTQP